MNHMRHIHNGGRTMENSNMIEGLWANLKYFIKNSYSSLPDVNMEDFLFEELWRR
jgi:hypothetical protein